MHKGKLWIGTNWKMTKTIEEGGRYTELLKDIEGTLSSDIQLFIIPSHTALYPVKNQLSESSILLGAQNMHWEDSGAFTGEVSPLMLNEIGIELVELGHSERRQYFNENDIDINKKVHAALHHKIKPLVCIGENMEQKNNSISKETLASQLKICLKGLTEEQVKQVMIAYEPVWAIGERGIPADSSYVADIHLFLRRTLVKLFGDTGREIPLLYGGSVNKDNFLEYIDIQNVNGLFIGRAAWNIESFQEILHSLDSLLTTDVSKV
ncbi:triosephosphate isomerase [Halobacillus dabanensis]|uniref:Triosephosphate isomerase n=1 Tax=Halobacillus dabanensis TaxID=240302 RepID=A0A1I3S0L0_HALDA|nr:triose-phosphate isomerase [Halobacillus dabanensis]SFJ52404.1 triosephosphate isomerase [Halobacillus dabanensis]